MKKNEYKIMYELERFYWWFVGKQFLVKQILSGLPRRQNETWKLLDVGSGTGIILQILEAFGISCGVENSVEAIQFQKKRGLKRIVRSDVNQSIPFRTDSFSTVTCLDVMEHLKSDASLLDEMIRICKPGGHIIITVPAYDCLWSPHDDALQHLRRYTRRQLLNHASRRDCRVVKATYFNTTLFPPIFVARKFQRWFSRKGELQSDLFLPLPNWANKALTAVYLFELCCLRFLAFPLGVSLLMILQKDKNERTGKRKNERGK